MHYDKSEKLPVKPSELSNNLPTKSDGVLSEVVTLLIEKCLSIASTFAGAGLDGIVAGGVVASITGCKPPSLGTPYGHDVSKTRYR